MSQENVEIVHRGFDAASRGDLDEWLSGFAPEAELRTTGRFADRRVYRGRAGLARFWAEFREDMENPSFSVSDIRAVGDRVFFAVTMRGRGKRSKAEYEERLWYLVRFRDRLVVRVDTYVDEEQALGAAGLSE